MDSIEILRQYLSGAMKANFAEAELQKFLNQAGSLSNLREATRARCALGVIRRTIQFRRGEASSQDICLNLRDAILYLGHLKVPQRVYETAKDVGKDYGLICEPDSVVSCLQKTPAWLPHNKYVEDVYALRSAENAEVEEPSIGDSILSSCTKFQCYKNFEQKIAVHTALNLPGGHTLLVSLPTGGGKSLITQVLASETNGLTLVIVPTVALALDQYHAAKTNLLFQEEIYCYRGAQSDHDRIAIIHALSQKKAKLLFASPEAIFKNTELFRLLEDAAKCGYMRNIVVDEAHVVPDWGIFFRPDFQIFSVILKKWRNLSQNTLKTYLLSATLSDDVVETLFFLFGSPGKNVQFRCDALRQEPRFYFYPAKTRHEQDECVMQAILLLPKPMVVYVLEPKEAAALQARLQALGYQNIPIFTGETKENVRDQVLTGWKNNQYDVVIATSAFGIGVDKPNVRTIVHSCVPENLSRYYQEVGRGGRDHMPSLSVFVPYRSNMDGNSDVHRAWGLVNKRVLTVPLMVSRWTGMMESSRGQVDGDICVLDTSATPPHMTIDEAEYAGNRNSAWNINLLLFLHRTGFIDLLDAKYDTEHNSYQLTAKLLNLDVLNDPVQMALALENPRQKEAELQLHGYTIIRDLVQKPEATCWGRVFKHLFPLSQEVCNGCPVDKNGRFTTDKKYKLRTSPELTLDPSIPSRKLDRLMGSYTTMLVARTVTGEPNSEEIQIVSKKACEAGLGTIIIPDVFYDNLPFSGLVLTYSEFYFVASMAPYLFSRGVLCIFGDDNNTNQALYDNLEKLQGYGYRCVLYCNEFMPIVKARKAIKDYIDGYMIPLDRL